MTQAADWFISFQHFVVFFFSETEIRTRNVSGARQKGRKTASLLKVVPHGIFFSPAPHAFHRLRSVVSRTREVPKRAARAADDSASLYAHAGC